MGARASRLVLVVLLVALVGPPVPALASALDYPVPGGHFYTQANGLPQGASGRGYAIVDQDGIPFWSEFRRLGGVQALGYPASHRFVWDGFVVQVTQRVVLQWRPEVGRVFFVNVFDRLAELGKDAWLDAYRATPPRFDTAPDASLSWEAITRRHWTLLDQNPAIGRRYWADPDPLQHFGLPMSTKDYGNVFVVRAQRAVLQQWKVAMPWARAGEVTVANGGDIAKEAGILPPAVLAPRDSTPVSVAPGRPSRQRWGYWVEYDPASTRSLEANAGGLDVVVPALFQLTGQGQIEGRDRPAVARLARASGARVVPMIQNREKGAAFHPALSDPAVRSRAVEAIAGLVRSAGYEGIHVDFEDLLAEDRAGLSAFMAELAGRLRPAGKLVSMAIGARTRDVPIGWAAPYDYRALAASNDYLVLMAYGYRTAGSAMPGSTAPLPWVNAALAHALAQIPAEKLILGIAWYGYDWNLTAGGRAQVLRFPEVLDLLQRVGAARRYSAADESGFFQYRSGGALHEVWFETAESFRAKRALADRHGLAGVAGWRLGHEDPAIWEVLR
ncbi:MAG: hypothetical protein HY331_05660 [Chloroflexi bacterium]|nr:hypothetical protein [Chloroflexota bacterium]